MTDLDKAREWAQWAEVKLGIAESHAYALAAAEIIQSLPDQWVDAEKLQEIADDMSNWSIPGLRDTTDSVRLSQMMDGFIDRLNELLTPKLPTLADMTEEEREACQWMQCEVETDDGYSIGVIRRIWSTKRADILYQTGRSLDAEYRRVTPLSDLPKLQWPRSISQEPTGASLDPQENIDASIEYIKKTASDQEPNDSETPKSSIKPEDVPPNEPWLVEANGLKAIGTRYKRDAHAPWAVAALDGSFADDYPDYDITLIHKLVPEPPALPEGMRLADHKEYGRVVVSPKVDTDGDYKVFHLNDRFGGGAVFHFVRPDDLTFLDGDQHA